MGRWVSSLSLFWAVLLIAPPTYAQDPGPEAAVRLAKAAFEYRDFSKVVELLDPWLHPPRIVDSTLEVRARELMGVSQHVLGQTTAAEEEFAQLLKLAPTHELDPFLVPPPVVQSFEEVRAKMKPILDRIIEATPKPEPPTTITKTEIQLVPVPHTAMVFLPFGAPQFVVDEIGWGLMWAGLQAAGLALNVGAWRKGRSLRSQAITERVAANLAGRTPVQVDTTPFLVMQYAGAALFTGGWVGSSVQGYGQLQSYRAELESALPNTDTVGLHWSGTF